MHGDTEIPAGEHQVRMEFSYDGGGLGKGGTVDLFLDGEPVGHGRVDATEPMMFSGDETTDVGSDSATPVSDEYGTTRQRVHRTGATGSRSTSTTMPRTSTTSSAPRSGCASRRRGSDTPDNQD